MHSDGIRIGISSCLLGEKVRYNGGHKQDHFITETLSRFFEWVPVCPEVDIGLGTPREPIRLAGRPSDTRLVTVETGIDLTEKMNSYARKKVGQLQKLELNGYILKKDSPSCGMERVKLYGKNNVPSRDGVGLFAKALMAAMPELPVEEEGRLNDMRLRENFITRVFSHYRWQELNEKSSSIAGLVNFHARHKLLLMAHSEKHMRELGRLVAETKGSKPSEVRKRYSRLFFEALSYKATTRKHTNVLQHIMGHFKKRLDSRDKNELLRTIDDYHKGLLPLIVPLTLIKHHVDRSDITYIKDQIYLNPHPKELMLLNHV